MISAAACAKFWAKTTTDVSWFRAIFASMYIFFLECNVRLSFRKTSDLFRFIKWYLQLLVRNFGQKQRRMYLDSELKLHYDISEKLQRWPNTTKMPHADHETRLWSGPRFAQRKALCWSCETCFLDYEFFFLHCTTTKHCITILNNANICRFRVVYRSKT